LVANIQSADAGERILAIQAAGQAKDQSAVPLLVDRLEDEDDAVRFFAILALDRITGQRLGFDYAQPPSRRAAAVERWRRYVRDRRTPGGLPADRTVQSAAGPTGDAAPRSGGS
jgi:HEAT repeat protein